MKYFWIDVKKLYRSRLVLLALIILLVIAVIDPITMQSHFAYQSNPFMWWLFMNRTTGSTIFNTLYWLFPVLLTGLVFFDESKTAIYGIIITKKKRWVYFCSKALSVFFVSFVSTLFLFLLNLFLVYVTCPSSMELSKTMIPHMGTFSALLFQKSPLYEAVTYVILHAFALSLLTVLYLAIQMIVKAKNKYMAFILPPIIMYVLDYLTQTAAQTYSVTMALQPMVARATSFVITIENIAIIFGALLAIDIVCLFIGNRRNRDVIWFYSEKERFGLYHFICCIWPQC